METLRTAFAKAKENDGAPGIDGVTFAAIEEQGVESFLEQIRDELTSAPISRCECGSGRPRSGDRQEEDCKGTTIEASKA